MKYTIFLALIFANCFLIACKKNFILDDPNTTGRTTTVPKLLKVISLDTTIIIGKDTLFKQEYKYDSQNRISECITTELELGDSLLFSIEKYFYFGNDTLPYKSTSFQRHLYTVLGGPINQISENQYKYLVLQEFV